MITKLLCNLCQLCHADIVYLQISQLNSKYIDILTSKNALKMTLDPMISASKNKSINEFTILVMWPLGNLRIKQQYPKSIKKLTLRCTMQINCC